MKVGRYMECILSGHVMRLDSRMFSLIDSSKSKLTYESLNMHIGLFSEFMAQFARAICSYVQHSVNLVEFIVPQKMITLREKLHSSLNLKHLRHKMNISVIANHKHPDL